MAKGEEPLAQKNGEPDEHRALGSAVRDELWNIVKRCNKIHFWYINVNKIVTY